MSAASNGDRAASGQAGAVAPGGNRRRWLILAVIATAQLMVVLDGTVVNIALPTAQRALAFSNADRQWIITGYALAFGSLLLLGGSGRTGRLRSARRPGPRAGTGNSRSKALMPNGPW